MNDSRPSKKQRELLNYIDEFIKSNGYGPSYREIMRALDYKSVSTVAVHVDGLILVGLLRKKDNSARSLEVVAQPSSGDPNDEHIKWLKRQIKTRQVVQSPQVDKDVTTLKTALAILLDQTPDSQV